MEGEKLMEQPSLPQNVTIQLPRGVWAFIIDNAVDLVCRTIVEDVGEGDRLLAGWIGDTIYTYPKYI
jgi:hypothetical protein